MKDENNNLNEDISNENIEDKTGEDLAKKVTELENELAQTKDKYLRKVAEFENFRKRTEAYQLSLFDLAAESFIKKILTVIDDFERSISHFDSAKDIDTLKQGIVLIYEKFFKMLEENGVKPIDAVGQKFDVHFHEAILQRPEPGVEPLTVLDQVEKGYLYKDKVIRHSKVIVSQDDTEHSNLNNE